MKSLSRKPSRLVALDIAKTFAILGVLVTHILFLPLRQYIVPWLGYIPVILFLMVNGFTYGLSLEAHGMDTFDKYYSIHLPRHMRSILWTYLAAFAFEVFYHSILITRLQPEWVWNVTPEDPEEAFRYYFRIREMMGVVFGGGLGPGAYYIPLLVLLALAFPIFYYPYKKHPIPAVALYWGVLRFAPLPQETRTFMTRLGYMIAGLVLYDLYRIVEGKPNRKWGILSGGIFAVGVLGMQGLLPFRLEQDVAVLGALALLLWACQSLPPENPVGALCCRAVGIVGGATFHIFLAQKVFCSTRFPAYLAIFHEFNDYMLMLTALVIGILFWFIDSRVTRVVFPLLDKKRAPRKKKAPRSAAEKRLLKASSKKRF